MNADSIHMLATSLVTAVAAVGGTDPTKLTTDALAPLLNPHPSVVALLLLASILVWVKTTFDEGTFGFWVGLGFVTMVAGWGIRPERPTLGTGMMVVPLVVAVLAVIAAVVMIRVDATKHMGRLRALSPDLNPEDARAILYRTRLWGGVVTTEQRDGLILALFPADRRHILPPQCTPRPTLRPVTLARWYLDGQSPERLWLALQGGLDDTMLNRHLDGDLPVDWDTIGVMAALRADR